MASWSDLFSEINEKFAIHVCRTGCRKILHATCIFFLSFLLQISVSLKTSSGYITFNIPYEMTETITSLHFLFVWTTVGK